MNQQHSFRTHTPWGKAEGSNYMYMTRVPSIHISFSSHITHFSQWFMSALTTRLVGDG